MFDLSSDTKKKMLAGLAGCQGFGKTQDGRPSVVFNRITIEMGKKPGVFGGLIALIGLYHGESLVGTMEIENCDFRSGDVLNLSGFEGLMPVSLSGV